MGKQHIHAFAITIPDYDQAIEYYCGVLGFELVSDIDMGGGKRWVLVRPIGAKETHILLARAVGHEQIATIGNQTGGRVFGFLHTDDFDHDYQKYRANGVDFIENPRNEPYGKVCKFRDAFGNLWDLLEHSQII